MTLALALKLLAPRKPRTPTDADRGWRGMHDAPQHPLEPGFVSKAQNVYLDNGRYAGRAGYEFYGRLGSDDETATVKRVIGFSKDGAYHEYAIRSNGTLWKRDTASNDVEAWAQVALAGGAAISSSASAVYDLCFFAGRLIGTDRVNRPWAYDGSTFTVLSTAPICGSLTVYSGKLFCWNIAPGGLAGGSTVLPYTFAWSEEEDPTQGYDAGFDNAWDFAITDQSAVLALVGFNTHLLILKQNSVAAAFGTVGADFRSDSTLESVDAHFGIVGRDAYARVGNDLIYVATHGVQRLVGGQGPPLDVTGELLNATWKRLDFAQMHRCCGGYIESTHQAIFAVAYQGDEDLGGLHQVLAYTAAGDGRPADWVLETQRFGINHLARSRQPKDTGSGRYRERHGAPYLLVASGTDPSIYRRGFTDEVQSDRVSLERQMLKSPDAFTACTMGQAETGCWHTVGTLAITAEVTDPDGGTGAYKLTPVVGAPDSYTYQIINDTRPGRVTATVWLRTAAGQTATLHPVILDNETDPIFGQAGQEQVLVTEEWKQYQHQAVFAAGELKRFIIGGFSSYRASDDPPIYVYKPYAQFDGDPIHRLIRFRPFGARRLARRVWDLVRLCFRLEDVATLSLQPIPLDGPYGQAGGPPRREFTVRPRRADGTAVYDRGLNVHSPGCAFELEQNERDRNFVLTSVEAFAVPTGDAPFRAPPGEGR